MARYLLFKVYMRYRSVIPQEKHMNLRLLVTFFVILSAFFCNLNLFAQNAEIVFEPEHFQEPIHVLQKEGIVPKDFYPIYENKGEYGPNFRIVTISDDDKGPWDEMKKSASGLKQKNWRVELDKHLKEGEPKLRWKNGKARK